MNPYVKDKVHTEQRSGWTDCNQRSLLIYCKLFFYRTAEQINNRVQTETADAVRSQNTWWAVSAAKRLPHLCLTELDKSLTVDVGCVGADRLRKTSQ